VTAATTITRLVFLDQANHHETLFGGEALATLATAGSIARGVQKLCQAARFGDLQLDRVNEPYAGAFGLMPYYYPAAEPEVRPDEAVWQQHRSRVQAFFAEAEVPGEFAGVIGQPADGIVDVAERHKAELIVVGTREPGFVERLLGGSVSVSQTVARRAHCDVLIAHGPNEND
jgi:nucleotide-binding universal stress UspA family protein